MGAIMFIPWKRCLQSVMGKSTLILFLLMTLFIAHTHATTVFTRMNTSFTGEEGLVIRIDIPDNARYNEGAPILIHGTGGFYGEGLTQRETGLTDQGFIEIRFNFPGSGTGPNLSGGTYDHRGDESLKAYRDIIQFACGQRVDTGGFIIDALTDNITPLRSNIGLVGWSNGGNTTKFHQDQNSAWGVNVTRALLERCMK